ncbi:DUF726 domain-containing protein [Aliarcobacter thereius]|uniref:DUF726 domain-containing protein n=1 Tax=Aliarcobacter thereius TaxID=544718 RepID=UPI0010FF5E98|nr:DUF726 domain-containing protein [Aliarcobacter thereius]TLT07827.1 DUF726 domain-containing protein [Aliarcobacter thereius]
MKLSEYKKYGLIPLREEKSNYDKIHIYVGGFLSRNINYTFSEWFENMKHLISVDDNIYLFNWDSGLDYTNIQNINFDTINIKRIVPFAFTRFNPASLIILLSQVIWSWEEANIKSKFYAKKLQKELLKFDTNKISLYSHSLGTKLVKNTLLELEFKKRKIDNLYLFGGATNSEDLARWKAVSKTVNNKFYNFYSENDEILKKIYKLAELGKKPIGLNILKIDNCRNIDVSYTVNGHFEYKNNLPTIFRNLQS